MENNSQRYIIPSTARIRADLAEMKCQRLEREKILAERRATRTHQNPQPTIVDVMEMLQKLMVELLSLQAKIG